ncbi:hypothetical protein BH23CYA1_BH23CYA1_02710 [soil metagenome]
MSRLNLLGEGKSYTFRSYFEMPYEIDEILAEFGVGFSAQKLSLPRSAVPSSIVNPLKADLESNLQIVLLSSETARREILVAPVLTKVALLSGSQLRIEYLLTVDEQLKGKLDYLIRGERSLLVIEAKNDDLTRGFTQLAVELIALSRVETAQKILYGAVTIGNAWVFGFLDVDQQTITQDTSLYRVPEDLQDVMEILMGMLTADQLATA